MGATEDMLDNGYNWYLTDLKLYSNLDCTGTNHNDGTPISSGGYTPELAFDTDDDSYWYGIPNDNGEYWAGMEYLSAREVLCLSYLDDEISGAKKFKIEGREMSLGMWTEIMMVEEHQSGQRQNISLPVFSAAPSTSSTPSVSANPSTSPS